MRVYINVKIPGKRRNVLEKVPYQLPDETNTLRELLTAVTRAEVLAYQERQADEGLLHLLTADQISGMAAEGKVSFGRVHSDQTPDTDAAVKTTLQAFEDGLVRVLVNGKECTALDESAVLCENAEVTFVRLTFLAGRMW